jgi:hypothetical protein
MVRRSNQPPRSGPASLAPGLTPKAEESGVTGVLTSPYTVPLDYLRWPIQFESKGTLQTNDVIVAIDHWSIWEPV